jgi:hypothetical protein
MAVNRALLVGINAYPGQRLAGCVRDVNELEALLVDRGHFAVGEIRLLADGRATRRAILDGFRWLIRGASPGSRLYFHYSGHGAQMPSARGGELVEVLCPVDFDWSFETALAGRELGALVDALPGGADFTWTLDASFLGDSAPSPGRGRALRARAMRAPAGLAAEIERRRELCAAVRPLRGPEVAERSVAIAACWANETAVEAAFDGRARGAFSRALVEVLRGPKGSTAPVSALPLMLSGALQPFGQHAVADGPRSAMARTFSRAEALDASAEGAPPRGPGRFDLEEDGPSADRLAIAALKATGAPPPRIAPLAERGEIRFSRPPFLGETAGPLGP